MASSRSPRRARARSGSGAADAATIAAILNAEFGDPFGFFGLHDAGAGLAVRTFQPDAAGVEVVDASGGHVVAKLPRIHESGLFVGTVPRKRRFAYRLRLSGGGATREIEDPYRFPPVLGDLDSHLIGEGTHLRLYDRLGAHPMTLDGIEGTHFAVWAPNARAVSVVGDFNAWDGRRCPMRNRRECGVWEIFLPAVGTGAAYKYEIKGPEGERLPLKADPLAFRVELRPRTAAIVTAPGRPAVDEAWAARRGDVNDRASPISIYECHLGSWMRIPEDGNRFLTYAELGDRLVPYVREMGFTHLELLPVFEHPFDGSWGYQPIGLYAPTARFGMPEDFDAFVARCHAEGIALILDWVPGHFPTDSHGLGGFDGTALYEHADPRLGFHPDWDTLIFNYGRREVVNYLTANALFWLDRYGVDGLRVDAVASMLYLDYSREPGEWIPNRHGGNENLEAVDFLRRMNELVYARHPGAATFAEESTAWPGVSRPTQWGGLGFGYKWNMGWTHHTLRYIQHEPVHRKHHHDDLTFGLSYAFSENYVLPLSHDEVVHGKGSLLGRMPGDPWQRFANLRAYFGLQWTHPGKKLLFMGCEIAQEREWNHDASLDWHLLASAAHRGVQALVRDLNRVYRATPALHARDCGPSGFEWVNGGDAENSVLSFLRLGNDGDAPVLVVCNFTPVVRARYRVGVPRPGTWRELLNTDAEGYGGSGVVLRGDVTADDIPAHGRPCSVNLTLPPLATLVLQLAAA